MNTFSRRLVAALLTIAFTVTPALASQAMGWELVRDETVLGPGVTMSTQTFWGDSRSDYRQEQYVTYTPSEEVRPVVVYGATVPSKATLTAMAQALEQYGSRVLAGANGDYFVMATGVPLGMVVTWGVVRSSSSYLYAVGFDADGSAFVGKPELTVWADFPGGHLAVSGGYNKSRTADGGMTLFSGDFGATTKASGAGIDLVLRPVAVPEDYVAPVYQAPELTAPTDPSLATDPVTGEPVVPTEEETAAYQEARAAYEAAVAEAQAAYEAALAASAAALETAPAELRLGGEKITCVVEQVLDQGGAAAIPQGRFVLSMDKQGSAYQLGEMSAMKVGQRLDLSVTTAEERWNGVTQAIGAYQLLLKDGVVQDGLDNTANPRTALGIKENGQVVLYTMDGRRAGHSVGASTKQIAARLKELGCVDAVLFDGGGSTTFGATSAVGNSFTLQNKPSDGGQRAVTNALFFVSDLPATGELGSLYVTAQNKLLLPGGQTNLTAQGIDTGYHPIAGAQSGVTYSVSGPGSVSGSVFTAAGATGKTEAVVTATAAGGQQGSTVLTVVPTPHGITVADQATGQALTSLNLDPEQSVDLTARATWYGLAMTATDESFQWSVAEDMGTVNEAGVLTAGSKAGSGWLTVRAGEKSVQLPLAVAGHILPMEDFEGTAQPFQGPEGTLALTTRQVKYGNQALQATLAAGQTRLNAQLPLVNRETDVAFWAYPEGEVSLTLNVTLADGTETDIPCAVGAPGHWSFVQAPLPAGAVAVTGLTVEAAGPTALYLDHFTSTNGGLRDETAPVVQLTCDASGNLRGTLQDNMDKTFAKENLSLTLDGKPLDFTLTGNTVTAQVELYDALLHRISLTAADASGNLARASVQLDAALGTASPFADTAGHWAAPFADYLYDRGISNGSPGPNGTLLFEPGTNITRGDFVTMLMRWLGTDVSQYESVELPFVDAADLKPWTVNAVKAAYALGIFTGSAEGNALYANGNQTITRSQVMTLLGRVQPRGYTPSAEQFLDQADIPGWAADHVASLVGQGVVSGFAGYVCPNDPITRGEVAKVLTTMW